MTQGVLQEVAGVFYSKIQDMREARVTPFSHATLNSCIFKAAYNIGGKFDWIG